jgi:hypothetical protein
MRLTEQTFVKSNSGFSTNYDQLNTPRKRYLTYITKHTMGIKRPYKTTAIKQAVRRGGC